METLIRHRVTEPPRSQADLESARRGAAQRRLCLSDSVAKHFVTLRGLVVPSRDASLASSQLPELLLLQLPEQGALLLGSLYVAERLVLLRKGLV